MSSKTNLIFEHRFFGTKNYFYYISSVYQLTMVKIILLKVFYKSIHLFLLYKQFNFWNISNFIIRRSKEPTTLLCPELWNLKYINIFSMCTVHPLFTVRMDDHELSKKYFNFLSIYKIHACNLDKIWNMGNPVSEEKSLP